MKTCPACGTQSAEGAAYCIRCGFSLGVPERGADLGASVPGRRLSPGDVVDGKYEVKTVLGEGGMGIVYLAQDIHMDLPVVIKSIRSELTGNPEYQARILAEGRALARIDHPNVVRLNAVVVERNAVYLVMQYIQGETLEDMIRRHVAAASPVSLTEATRVFQGILEGVRAVHEQGVIHRDLKPANILIRARDGVPKVTDFGIAKWEWEAKAGRGMTKGVIGSLWYMAPEQVRGQRDVDKRIDVYALGILFFEMLTGRVPFDAPSDLETMRMHAEVPLPSVVRLRPDLPPQLDDLLQRACAKDRDERYPSCEEFLTQLAHATGAGSTERREPRPDLYLGALAMRAPMASMAAAAPSVSARATAVPSHAAQQAAAAQPYGMGGIPHAGGTVLAAQAPGTVLPAQTPRALAGAFGAMGGPAASVQAPPAGYGRGGTQVAREAMARTPPLPGYGPALPGTQAEGAHGTGDAKRSSAGRVGFVLGIAALSAAVTMLVVWAWPQASPPHGPVPRGVVPDAAGASQVTPVGSLPAATAPPATATAPTLAATPASPPTPMPSAATPQEPPSNTVSTRAQLESMAGPYASVPAGQPPSPARDYRVDVSTSGDALEFHIVDPQQFEGQGYAAEEVRLRLHAVAGRPNTFWVEDRLRPKAPPGTAFDPGARDTCLTTRENVNGTRLLGTFDRKTQEFAVAMVRLRTESDKAFEVEGNRIVRCSFASAKVDAIQSRIRRKRAN